MGRRAYWTLLTSLGAAFLLLGIGADDVFVFVDAFKQSEHMASISHSLLKRLEYTSLRASKAVLITSLTTTVAFLATTSSRVMPISTFGIYASLCIFLLYWVNVIIMPPTLIVWDRIRKRKSRTADLELVGPPTAAEGNQEGGEQLAEPGQGRKADEQPEGVDLDDYKTRFVVMNLLELSQEQQRNVIQMQLQGNAFFEHLVNIAECRKDLDALYRETFRSEALRNEVERLGMHEDVDEGEAAATLQAWLPPPDKLLRIAECEGTWRCQSAGASHPALLCARLHGERLMKLEEPRGYVADCGLQRVSAFERPTRRLKGRYVLSQWQRDKNGFDRHRS